MAPQGVRMLGCAAALAVALCPSPGAAQFDYVVNDYSLYPIPLLAKPDKGVPFTDPVFNVTVTRITDSVSEAESATRSCYSGYPKHDIENADGTMLFVEGSCSSNVGIYDAATFEKILCLAPAEYGFYLDAKSPVDPRWDDEDPNKLFFTRRMTFNYYNHLDTHAVLLHDFSAELPDPENVRISLAEEGDGSLDRSTWAFSVVWNSGSQWSCYNVVSYDADTDEVLGILERPSGSCGNWVSATPYGKVALGTSPVLIYDRRFENPPVEIDASGGVHGDFAIDDDGREVYFHGRNGWWRMEDLETGETINLVEMDLGPSMGYHVSGNARDLPGWGLISTYANGQVTPTHWADYAIFLVELTRRSDPPPRVWRVVHTHCADQETHSYSSDPFGKLNTRGTKIWWTSNWDDPDGRRDIYQVDLPDGWHADLFEPLCTAGETRVCGTDVGRCETGTQQCVAGSWGPCQDAVEPVEEICDDGEDNDCDTFTDEHCGVDAGAADAGGSADVAGTDAAVMVDGGGANADAAGGDGGACVPFCLDDTQLQTCNAQGQQVVLSCGAGQRCEEGRCVGDADAGSGAETAAEGCQCRGAPLVSASLPSAAALLAGWRRRRRARGPRAA